MRRMDPDNPGGARLGSDNGDDDFTGYPADPGEPGDNYYDTTAEHRAYSPNWTGAFLGFGLHGGVSSFAADWLDGRVWGPQLGAGVHLCSVSSIFEGMLDVRGSRLQGVRDGQDTGIQRHSVSASLGVHPAFLWLIGSTRADFTTADLLLFGGPSLDHTLLDDGPDGEPSRWWRPGYHAGVRVETPLDNPHNGRSVWLGVMYRYQTVSAPTDPALFPRQRSREHVVSLRMSWRVNGYVLRRNLFGGP